MNWVKCNKFNNDDLINDRYEINHNSASRKEILKFNYYKYDKIRQLFLKDH